jgi:RNA polymerase II C-terminal domain phosphatase-like 3/4
MGGICIRCGAHKPSRGLADPAASAEDAGDSVALRYIHRELEISGAEAARLRRGTSSRVLSERRLLLVLDLDHTLLNSTRFCDLTPEAEALLQAQEATDATAAAAATVERGEGVDVDADATKPPPPLLRRMPHMHMWTKLRPGVYEFLATARELFELHVYTMGDRDYAAEMAQLLDPGGKLFAGRVISSGDSTQRWVKDLDVVLGSDEAVLILDDTPGVWPAHKGNLIQIERYVYFPACAGKFAAMGGGEGPKSRLERAEDEEGDTGPLSTALGVLRRVHAAFFNQGG